MSRCLINWDWNTGLGKKMMTSNFCFTMDKIQVSNYVTMPFKNQVLPIKWRGDSFCAIKKIDLMLLIHRTHCKAGIIDVSNCH